MKLTNKQLKQIIKEELENVIESREELKQLQQIHGPTNDITRQWNSLQDYWRHYRNWAHYKSSFRNVKENITKWLAGWKTPVDSERHAIDSLSAYLGRINKFHDDKIKPLAHSIIHEIRYGMDHGWEHPEDGNKVASNTPSWFDDIERTFDGNREETVFYIHDRLMKLLHQQSLLDIEAVEVPVLGLTVISTSRASGFKLRYLPNYVSPENKEEARKVKFEAEKVEYKFKDTEDLLRRWARDYDPKQAAADDFESVQKYDYAVGMKNK